MSEENKVTKLLRFKTENVSGKVFEHDQFGVIVKKKEEDNLVNCQYCRFLFRSNHEEPCLRCISRLEKDEYYG